MKHKHHIIPKHMGGSDELSNLIELTPDEHAEAHRILYEEYGHWQDYVAWQGLAKLTEKKDLIKKILSESGKKGALNNHNRKGTKYKLTGKYSKTGKYPDRKGINNPCAKEFLITHPNGEQETVKSLKTWCENHNLNYNTFSNQCLGRKSKHKGYSAIKL